MPWTWTLYNKNKYTYHLFSYFISCAFLGWVFETTAVLILNHQLTARGFLFITKDFPFVWGMPIIEIYGIGGCLIVLFFSKIKNSVFLFLGAIISMTLFELISSYFCSYILHHTYWDYSNEFANFQGRICLRSSVTWGIISILTIKYLIPKLEWIYAEEERIRNYKNVVRVVFVFTLLCNVYKFVYL
jgi:uncharacterized membrane protein